MFLHRRKTLWPDFSCQILGKWLQKEAEITEPGIDDSSFSPHRARMTAKQCLRHEWLRGAPTQASPHLRRYLSKSREVLLERVVSRENLRRATLLSQAKSHANLSEAKSNQGLGGNLSQSEMCLSYGMTGSQISLPDSEGDVMSPAHSQISLESNQNTFALSQSCLLNKEQTQGLLSQAQSKSHANLSNGPSRGILSRMRNLSETQSQVCLLNTTKSIPRHVQNPLFSRSRDKLYGLKSLSKSQGVLDIYRSLECLKTRKNQRARTEDMMPIFKQLGAEIAASNASLASVDLNIDLTPDFNQTNEAEEKYWEDVEAESNEVDKVEADRVETKTDESVSVVAKSTSYDSEGNLDSLQSVESIESDTLTEDSDETASRLSVKQTSKRQNSDISSHSNNSGNSDDKDDNSESENDEPKYTVAQLVSAFNKHQEVASKTSLEAIMTEKRINEVNFPTGPKALRLFIPDINITESTIVRRKTSYKPRKNWEELRKMNERNEGLTKREFYDDQSANEDDDEEETRTNKTESEDSESLKIDEKYAQCVQGVTKHETSVKPVQSSPTVTKDNVKDSERSKFTVKVDNGVNLKDILQRVDNSQTSPKENLENLRKRTSIAKIILNDNQLGLDEDANNNGSAPTPPIQRAKSEPPSAGPRDADKMQLDIPPSFVRSSSLSSESSCLTPSSVQSDIGMSWEDVRVSVKSQKEFDNKISQKRIPTWEISGPESNKSGQDNARKEKGSTVSLEERKIWGKVCTGSYTRAMEKFNNGKSPAEPSSNKKSSSNLLSPTINNNEGEKTRRKSSPAMPQFLNP